MVIGEKVLYLELQKTGCTHVRDLLISIPDIKAKIIGKHNSIYDVPKEALGNLSAKIKTGNIRNPWDWYVSLWAFGSMEKGGLYLRVTNKRIYRILKNPKRLFSPSNKWQKVYSDHTNPVLFREWLKMILSAEKKYDIGEDYSQGDCSNFIGLMTYRYLQLYTYDFDKRKNSLINFNDFVSFSQGNNLLDFVIKKENLEDDFKKLMIMIEISPEAVNNILLKPKTNSSIHEKYRQYYDEETIELVSKKDKLIIDKFNYQY